MVSGNYGPGERHRHFARLTLPGLASLDQKAGAAPRPGVCAWYMVNGLRDGFHIGFDHARCSCGRARANMASTSRDVALVLRYLDEECRLCRGVGPLNRLP